MNHGSRTDNYTNPGADEHTYAYTNKHANTGADEYAYSCTDKYAGSDADAPYAAGILTSPEWQRAA